MALSAKMLALIQKIEAAHEVHFAGLREDVKKEAQARARLLEKKRANLCVARAVQKTKLRAARTRSAAKKKPKG
jgi:hypothetical protein